MEIWLLIAFIAPALWAIVNLIDVYFVDSVYSDAYDGAIISGLFQILPWTIVLVGFWEFQFSSLGAPHLFIAGAFFLWSVFFYFQALFSKNDAALIQLLWNLTAPVTIFFAWLFYRDTLIWIEYLGALLVLLGASFLSLKGSLQWSEVRALAKPMLPAIFLLALSMVSADYGYQKSPTSFLDSYLLFSLGSVFAALVLLGIKIREGKRRLAHIAGLSKKYFFVFLVAELVALVGTVFSQRAIDLAPSPALVATIESLSPAFVMLFSFGLLLLLRLLKSNTHVITEIYREQCHGYPVKIVSMCIISGGIYLLSLF